ncbi:Glycosyltransferase involved in cell wall bisynthesis [Saliniramus fredricksonii]|uniref:Glycosyltransferase involved in cell wall bisynthesis n=2 Tax=Saliniramus fredricksonii TaxID=1653334 RepID=A0ABY0K6X7_9HYPH|nr:Glycosyltransferase involved in cell wall bisynthesis [Saliniramus fredricksonii]
MTTGQYVESDAERDPDCNQRLDLLCVLPHLGPGGAQKIALMLARYWAARGYRVGVLTTLDRPADAHEVPEGVVRLRGRVVSTMPPGKYAQGDDEMSPDDTRHEERAPHPMARLLGRSLTFVGRSGILVVALSAAALATITSRDARRRRERRKRIRTWSGAARAIMHRECAEIFSISDAAHVFMRNARRGVGLLERTLRARRLAKALERARRELADAPPDVDLAEATEFVEVANAVDPGLTREIDRAINAALTRSMEQRVEAIRDVLVTTRPACVVAFLSQTCISTLIASRGLDMRVIISERNDPARQPLAEPWDMLRRAVYNRADVVTANSHGAVDSLAEFVRSAILCYVPNFVEIPEVDASVEKKPIFVCCARLVEQKAIDVAILAFARIAQEHPEWELHILGDGPLREELEEMAQAHDVREQVVFHGFVEDPLAHFREARVFVLPSRFEGTPNALLEALSCKVPTIVSDSSPGPLEYVTHEETGLVVPTDDVDALADAMRRMANGEVDQATMARCALERLQVVASDRAFAIWEEILAMPERGDGGSSSERPPLT